MPMTFMVRMLAESWHILLDSSVYMIFGLAVSGMLRGFMNPDSVARHLGQGRYLSVFKAALIGIPLPL